MCINENLRLTIDVSHHISLNPSLSFFLVFVFEPFPNNKELYWMVLFAHCWMTV